MKRNIIILLVTMLCGAGLTYLLDYTESVPPSTIVMNENLAEVVRGEHVPFFTFKDISGQNHIIEDHNGKIIVLNFWASWCAPCVKEFPHFLTLAQEYPKEVIFIGLSSDHEEDAMIRFVERMRSNYPDAMAQDNVILALDEGGQVTRDIFQTFRLPETIIIDSNGVMREKLIGADWNYADIKKIVTMIGDGS